MILLIDFLSCLMMKKNPKADYKQHQQYEADSGNDGLTH